MTASTEPMYERIRAAQVRDAMTTDVAVARPDDSLLSAAQTMRERRVSGLPVIDAHGAVTGVLSERDIFERLRTTAGLAQFRGVLDLIVEAANGRSDRVAQCARTLKASKVGETMSRRAVTIDPDAPLSEAARWFRQAEINRLPVVEGERLVGIVTRDDIIRIASATTTTPVRKRHPS
jgi:CBS domain-containing protein